jgi:hypothetical protein
MSLLFRYRPFSTTGSAAFSPIRMKPIIPVSVVGPQNTFLVQGLLDTGADETVFSNTVAQRIGLDLTNAPSATFVGVSGVPMTVSFVVVRLRVATNSEQREWTATVGFTTAPLRTSLLGRQGVLQYFDAMFRGEAQEVELTINASYAGS